MLLTIASITNDDYFHLHTLLFTEKHFLQKCSVYLFCESMPLIQVSLNYNNNKMNNE